MTTFFIALVFGFYANNQPTLSELPLGKYEGYDEGFNLHMEVQAEGHFTFQGEGGEIIFSGHGNYTVFDSTAIFDWKIYEFRTFEGERAASYKPMQKKYIVRLEKDRMIFLKTRPSAGYIFWHEVSAIPSVWKRR